MPEIRAIARLMGDWGDAPASSTCLAIIEFLASTPASKTKHLTINTLRKIANKSQIDLDLMAALNILGTDNLNVLEAHATFYDESGEYDISTEDFFAANELGVLVHPETGEVVEQFADKLVPYFTASPEFLSEIQNDK